MEKLNLKNIKKAKPRFNTLDELGKLVAPSKMPMFTTKASRIVVAAAKDTGKSFPVDLYKTMVMERDPMASGITTMKYSTGATKRGTRSFWKAYTEVSKTHSFPIPYEPSTGFMYKMKDKKNKLKNQAIEYGSFENSDAFAGYTVSNGGYPAFWHIEEPVLQSDVNVPSKKEWDADYKTILDTVKRHHRTYSQTNPFHKPIPFKTFITMNDWEPSHPVSLEIERFHKQVEFLNWVLGFDYNRLLVLWKDKINGEDVIFELKSVVDSRWEEIKKGVLERHTKWKYVDRDKSGIKIDTLYGRMQKFANPSIANDDEAREEVYDEMYHALITGNSLGLAKAFGMGFGGTDSDDLRFNFKSFIPEDGDKLLAEKGRELLGYSIGWDHDANRGPVGTPVTLSATRAPYNRFTKEGGEYNNIKVIIHEQIEIEGYGKGAMGANTAYYHELMIEASKNSFTKYTKNRELEYGTYAVFDDDDGSYISKMVNGLLPHGFSWVDTLENKNGKIHTGGFGVASRDDYWSSHVDLKNIIIDEKNTKLVEWLKQVPKVISASGEVKRSTKGKWGSRLKDISNSAEYGWWPWRAFLMDIDTK